MRITARACSALAFLAGTGRYPSASAFVCGASRPTAAFARKMTATATDAATFEEVSSSYRDLLSKLKAVTQLKRVSSVLSYDQQVFMPHADEASAARGAQMAALAGVIHEKATDKVIRTLLDNADADLAKFEGSTTDEKRILQLTREAYEKNERIPAELEARKAELGARAHSTWVKARSADDFTMFQDTLKECFDTAKEVADAQRGEDKDVPLYTQMLDDYEEGMPAERIDQIFGDIEDALIPLLSKVLESKDKPSTNALKGTFPIDAQEELSKKIVTALGFDESHGRIDVSVHPFTMSMSPSDVRITSRFREDEWYQGLAGSVHEGGHAMYEQNLANSGLDIDNYLSMGCHESQSLFWERHVGLSLPFWKWASPLLKEAFGDDFNFTPEEVYGAVNGVVPGLIRVEADELCYPLHVILRYRLEREVVEGTLEVSEIPNKWNQMMKDMIGVDVPDDAQGCLQDVHWSALAIGYFPTYLLGSATAAQLAHYCKQDIPDFEAKIEAGEFKDIKAWLTDKVHKHGRRYSSLDALLEDQLGEPLNPTYFIEYLTTKYTDIYEC